MDRRDFLWMVSRYDTDTLEAESKVFKTLDEARTSLKDDYRDRKKGHPIVTCGAHSRSAYLKIETDGGTKSWRWKINKCNGKF